MRRRTPDLTTADRKGRRALDRAHRSTRRESGTERGAPHGDQRASGSDRGGSSIVELAILWPLLVLVIFGSVQVATYFTARTVAMSAAQLAVSAERRYDATPGVGRDRAEAYLASSGDWLVQAEVDDPVRTPEEVFVTVRGEALSILPGVRWEIEQTARGTIERFTEAP
jgi:Flp pilus assembly protein TadG